ncbi:MAG: hypothetical protein FWH05_00985 [Oscillospiraceae bacterium]|nr:hypothetical protein [Oscillospiraceae bacterium]
MRVTSNTVVRRYLQGLERNFSGKNDAEVKVMNNRKFFRASQNPIDAAKALKVRKATEELKTYEYNLNTAKGIYETAESAVMKVSELIQATYEKLIYGANGTQSPAEEKIIAETIRTYADEMVQMLNIKVADRNVFGGTSNASMPFRMRENQVYYNGIHVNTFQNPVNFPYGKVSYSDIGIGMSIGPDERIDHQSALPVTFNGMSVMGCGYSGKSIVLDLEQVVAGAEYSLDVFAGNQKRTITFYGGFDPQDTAEMMTEALEEAFGIGQIKINESGLVTNNILGVQLDIVNTPLGNENSTGYIEYEPMLIDNIAGGYSNNIIQLTLDAAACLESGDKLETAKFADALFAIQTNLSLVIADIGNKQEFIDFNLDRITNNLYTLAEQQNTLEGLGPDTMSEQITIWKVMESIYNTTLRISASTVPMSIFNFMN